MKLYQCHKQVHGKPMNRGFYNKFKGWETPEDEDPTDEGYMVVYNMGTNKEYISWSPKDIFEDGYTVK